MCCIIERRRCRADSAHHAAAKSFTVSEETHTHGFREMKGEKIPELAMMMTLAFLRI